DRPCHPSHPPRRAAAAVERAPRRHELRRTAAGTPGLCQAAGAADSLLRPSSRRQTRHHRLGPGAVSLRRLDRVGPRETALRPVLHQALVRRVRPDHRHRHGQDHPVAAGVAVAMYERFYRLRESPFALTPGLAYLYLSPNHRDALDHLRLGLEAGAGFVVLTGEIGCGKKTLLQTPVTSLAARPLVAGRVAPLLEPAELIEALLIDFGVDQIPATKPAMVR